MIIVVYNSPTPYRTIIFDKLNSLYKGNFAVIYSNASETNRHWVNNITGHVHFYLNSRKFTNRYGYDISISSGIIRKLYKLKAQYIIGFGFNPVIIKSFLYAKLFRRKFILLTDVWAGSDYNLNIFQNLTRKLLYKYSDAVICISEKGVNYAQYNQTMFEKIFISPLPIDSRFCCCSKSKQYDVLYVSQFIDIKLPLFFANVIRKLNNEMKGLKVLIVGSGKHEKELLNILKKSNIDYEFKGYLQPENLPVIYSTSKILLFPTLRDAWGMVAAESLSCGTPVITTKHAGIAHEIIKNGVNGYILEIDEDLWVSTLKNILLNDKLYDIISNNCVSSVSDLNSENSVKGFVNAIEYIKKQDS